MITYLINFTLCSTLLFAVYALLLQNKVMYGFNRFYLLLAIGFSLVVPLVSIEQQVTVVRNMVEAQVEDFTATDIMEADSPTLVQSKPHPNYLMYAGVSIYLVVAACLLLRFAVNLFKLRHLVKTHERLRYDGYNIVLINDSIAPHSFVNCIFVSEADYRTGRIGNDILKHEQAHISQRHTIDILLMELLQAICWFNPVLILYRRAVRLNHEFLADAAVLSNDADVKTYQYLLLNQFSQTHSLAIASSFNYSNTKKRLIMMTMKTSRGASAFAHVTAFVVLTGAFMLFCQKTQAFQQDDVQPVKQKSRLSKETVAKINKFKERFKKFSKYPHTEKGASAELMSEYASLIAKNESKPLKQGERFASVSPEDEVRMEEIFRQMSLEQQEQQKICFRTPFPKLPKRTITQQELQSWKENVNIYGVWIDEKQVKNEELAKYTTSEFSRYSESKLAPNAKNYKYHKYQVDLMTNAAYERYLAVPQPKYIIYYKSRPVVFATPIATVTAPKPLKKTVIKDVEYENI